MGARKEKVPEEIATAKITGCNGRPQRQRGTRTNKFNAASRQKFLDALALTCNVTMSAKHAGMTPRCVYHCRSQDPVFKAQWREALESGLERLEMMVVEHGGAGLPLEPADPDRAIEEGASPAFDFDKAIRALQVHAKTRTHFDARSDAKIKQATTAETDAAILDLLKRIRRKVADATPPAMLLAPDGKANR